MTLAAALAWAIAPASAALLAFFLWRGALLGRLFVDALAIGVTLGAAIAVALAPFDLRDNPMRFAPQTLAFLFAGLPEEGVKMLGVAAFLRGHFRARSRRDVVFAAGALSLGFSALENVFYLANAGAGWATLAVERALTATPFHVCEGLAGGYVVARLSRGPRGFALGLLAWLGLAAIHGVYDFAVFAGASSGAAPAGFARLVAALGLDTANALRALLAAAEAAAAVAASAAVLALPAAPFGERRPWLLRLARSRGIGRLVGVPLAGAAFVALAGAIVAALLVGAPDPLFRVALYAVLPLALGLLFILVPTAPPAPLSRGTRRAFVGAGVAASLALLTAAVVWGPTEWRWLTALRFEALGARMAADGDYARAIDAYTRALEIAPGRIDILAQRAAAYAAAERYDPALADLDAALRVSPGNVGLYEQRASVDRQRNDPDAGVADLDAALKVKADDPELLALRGQARLESGDAKGAYDDLAAASRAAPDNAVVRRTFASWDVDAGDFDAGLRDLNARLHAEPGDAVAAFQRGRVWLYKGDARRARDDFARADRDPSFLYPALWRFLAQARLGGDGTADLAKRLAAAPDKWPAPVARLLLGQLDLAAARGAAANDGERCEADFYYAASRLMLDSSDQSAPRLRAALAECPTGFIEYEGAKAELRRLGQ